jgi:hypothetical protein
MPLFVETGVESMDDQPKHSPPMPGEELPATYVNYFHANVQPDHTRITFGEMNPNSRNVYYRSSFVMTTENARLLADLINRLAQIASKEG